MWCMFLCKVHYLIPPVTGLQQWADSEPEVVLGSHSPEINIEMFLGWSILTRLIALERDIELQVTMSFTKGLLEVLHYSQLQGQGRVHQ